MTDFLIQPQQVSVTQESLISNYKSSTSDAVSFGQKSNYQSEATQPVIGFKFSSGASNDVIAIVHEAQPDQDQNYHPSTIIVVQKTLKNTSSSAKLRPSSVTPVKRANRDTSPLNNSRPGSALRGRAQNCRDLGVTNVEGMSSYINKRSMERSVELHAKTTVENKKVQAKSKVSGKTVLDTTNQRRQLERQVAELENRIKRMQTEESTTNKQIEVTETKTKEAMSNKARHCEEKAMKELRNQKREESVQRLKEENQKTRAELKNGLRKSLIGKMKGNYEQAQVLKRVNEEKMEVVIQDKKKAAEEKRAANKALIDSINANKTTRAAEDESAKKETITRYADKANIEKERARELSLKCKELEKLESEMMAKLSTTKSLLVAKKSHFRKVSGAKGVIAVDRSATEEN